jgi:hypothetical protein
MLVVMTDRVPAGRRATLTQMFRRRPFDDLIRRQLDLFQASHGHLVDEAVARRRALADADEQTEAFGDYQDAVGWAAEGLVEIEDSYADTLEGRTARSYRRAFRREAGRRYPLLAGAFVHVQDETAIDEDE